MIGLKPFTDPIKSIVDVLSHTGENKENEEEGGEGETTEKESIESGA